MKHYFTKTEIALWSVSAAGIVLSFAAFDGKSYLTLAASLVGVTSIIVNAKGNPIGQGLMIVFSLLYGIISYGFSYYGEMITYLGMTMPMSVYALVAWLKNPYKGNKSEVRVRSLTNKNRIIMWVSAIIVTAVFYFILEAFDTANIVPSTVSVTTSFLAVYLTGQRTPYFALAYAANDVVLIILWSLASIADPGYISVVVCFVAFLANDIYGFISWKKIEQRQKINA